MEKLLFAALQISEILQVLWPYVYFYACQGFELQEDYIYVVKDGVISFQHMENLRTVS